MMISWKILSIGTSTSLLIWDLCQKAFISNIRTGISREEDVVGAISEHFIEGFTTSLLLHPPFYLRLGTSPCVEVRDLASGDILKTITDNYFSSLRSNGRFLAAPESQRNTALRAGDTFYRSSYRSRVVLMDIQGAPFSLLPSSCPIFKPKFTGTVQVYALKTF